MSAEKFCCLCCLLPGMGVKLDKKLRPFLSCTMCGTIIFPRGGALAAFCALHTLRLLDRPSDLSFVRAGAYGAASAGESSLLAMLRPVDVAVPVAASFSPPARVAANG